MSSGESTRFFVHRGSSMLPALADGDVLDVASNDRASPRIGDVVLFLPSGFASPVAHRVIRLAVSRIITRGDNNDREDPWPLRPADILGRVVAARRGAVRRRIRGGRAGLVEARAARRARGLAVAVRRMLHLPYRRFAAAGVIYRLSPSRVRPRLVVFGDGAGRRTCLMLGSRVVGRYDPFGRCWRVRRPYRLLIDPQLLAAAPSEDGVAAPPVPVAPAA